MKTHPSAPVHHTTARVMRTLSRALKDRTTVSERAGDARNERVLVEQGQFVRSFRS